MKKIALASFAFVLSLPSMQAEIPPGSKLYIKPFSQFETYLAAAFSKKHIPVVIVQNPTEADLTLSVLNDGQRVTGLQIENRQKEIVWTYLLRKPGKAERKEAEKCAAQLRW